MNSKSSNSLLNTIFAGWFVFYVLPIIIPMLGFVLGSLISGGVELLGYSPLTWHLLSISWVAIGFSYAITRDQRLLISLLVVPVVVCYLGTLRNLDPLMGNADLFSKQIEVGLHVIRVSAIALTMCGGVFSVFLAFARMKTGPQNFANWSDFGDRATSASKKITERQEALERGVADAIKREKRLNS